MTTWDEIARHDLYWLLSLNEAISVRADQGNFNLDPPPDRGGPPSASAQHPMQGVDTERPPEDGPQGGRWVRGPG